MRFKLYKMIILNWLIIHIYKSFISIYSFMYNLYVPIKPNINKRLKTSVILILFMLIIFVMWGIRTGLSLYDLTGFKWRYFSALEYCAFSIFTFIYAEKKFKNTYHALDYTIQSIFTCAFLYEIPYGLTLNLLFKNILSKNYITLRLSIVFLLYRLKKYNFKTNKKTILITLIYLLFSFVAYKYSVLFYISKYARIVRIPTMIYIFSLLSFTHLDYD